VFVTNSMIFVEKRIKTYFLYHFLFVNEKKE
jgi:hypothetical protein